MRHQRIRLCPLFLLAWVLALCDSVRDRMVRGMRVGFSSRTMLTLATANAVGIMAWAPYWFQWSIYFKSSLGAGIQVVGWLFCLFGLGGMIGAELAARFPVDPSRRAAFMGAMSLLATVMMFSAGFLVPHSWIVMSLFFAANIFCGA